MLAQLHLDTSEEAPQIMRSCQLEAAPHMIINAACWILEYAGIESSWGGGMSSSAVHTSSTLPARDIHHVSRQGVHPLALLGVLAIITQIDGSVASLRQLSVVSCHDGAAQNLQGLLVARDQHSHMIRVSHLSAHKRQQFSMSMKQFACVKGQQAKARCIAQQAKAASPGEEGVISDGCCVNQDFIGAAKVTDC